MREHTQPHCCPWVLRPAARFRPAQYCDRRIERFTMVKGSDGRKYRKYDDLCPEHAAAHAAHVEALKTYVACYLRTTDGERATVYLDGPPEVGDEYDGLEVLSFEQVDDDGREFSAKARRI